MTAAAMTLSGVTFVVVLVCALAFFEYVVPKQKE